MKKYLSILSVIFLVFFSCSKEDKEKEYVNLYLESDMELVNDWIYNDYNPDMNPSMEFTLKDLTTIDIQDKLDARVYTIVSDVPGLAEHAVFVKDNVVYDLGRYNLFGANEPENLLVTDVDGDDIYELFFTLTHGSGILRTNIICYINGLGDKYLISNGTFMFPLDYTIGLKQNDTYLDITYTSGSTKLNIGEVTLAKVENELKCMIELDDDLPQSVMDDISGE